MKLHIYSAFPKNPINLIIPLAKNDGLSENLAAIAERFHIPKTLLEDDFSAKAKTIQSIYSCKYNAKIFLLGLGKEPTFSTILQAFRKLSHQLGERLSANIGIDFLGSNLESSPNEVEAAINGLLLGSYDNGFYKTADTSSHPLTKETACVDIFIAGNASNILMAAKRGQAAAETQMSIMNLVDAPGNKATPEVLANWAVNSGKKYGYTVKVLDKAAIEEAGLHALLAVNRGSEYPPTFIIMEYKSAKEGEKRPSIGLVGKGVTFDTGGLSIKSSNNMHFMKSDMGGAAAVFGAMELTAKLQLPVHLVGIVPSTDNCVDGTSIKPGDVINSFSGKTIEVIDTDAEGRLILADGLNYMSRHFDTDVMLDLATLTGSCVRTFGYQAGGLMTNDDKLSTDLIASGEQTGERLWRLPLWDEYKKDIESDVADVRNFSGRPVGGAISAAKFLEVFTEDHAHWAHLDIAGVAFGSNGFSKMRSATGYGVRLLSHFIEHFRADE